MNEKINHILSLSFIVLIIAVAPLTAVIIMMRNQNQIIYEKRALIFHANIVTEIELEDEIITLEGFSREYYHDVKNLIEQLIARDYITTWYYYDRNETVDFDLLQLLQEESQRSEQLVIIFCSHGYYDKGFYYHYLEKAYSSRELMNALNKKTKTFIYSAACFSGYFAEEYALPENWVVLSSVAKKVDLMYGNITFDIDTNGVDFQNAIGEVTFANFTWPSIEAFVAAMKNYSVVELIYLEQLNFLAKNYLGTDYFSWENAPIIWDGDLETTWSL
ncbi:MAG: hypothetical protein HZR80_21165 [Candidatus Heimdallarchaeota archaeon]